MIKSSGNVSVMSGNVLAMFGNVVIMQKETPDYEN